MSEPEPNIPAVILSGMHKDDFAFLEFQAEETGLTPELVVFQMIRKARKAYERQVPAAPGQFTDEQAALIRAEQERIAAQEAQRQREIAEKRARLQAELAAIEDDTYTSVNELYYGPSGVADKPVPRPEINVPEIPIAPSDEGFSLPEFDERLLAPEPADPLRNVTVIQPPSAQPGALTAPAGVRPDLRGGDIIGDSKHNIVRRNFPHLGAGKG